MIFRGLEFLGTPHLHTGGCGQLAWIQRAAQRLVRADTLNNDDRDRCMSCGVVLE